MLTGNLQISLVIMSLLQRRRQIEAINGAWAMIGLTAGLVIEGHTGKSILDQVKLIFLCVQLCMHIQMVSALDAELLTQKHGN